MHLRAEDLEQYAMGTLASPAVRDFELHLLVIRDSCCLSSDRLAAG
jgi:hypothetical protein